MKHFSFVRSAWAAKWCAGAAALLAIAGQSGARQAPFDAAFGLAMSLDEPKPTVPDNDFFSDGELEDLLGPIALYPDVLLSAVLGASVFPEQVNAAAAFVASGATREQIEAQDWEDPVKSVAQVPEVIAMMGQYPDWTRAIGSAFLMQARDVMDSIQRLRSIAFDNGVLETSPQQVVTVQQETQKIVIMPANPTVIYVPQYNPSVVFIRDDRAVARAGFIGFGAGIAVGAIIWGGSCNWNGGFIGWGRGWGWGGWGNTRVNNNVNVNINNNRNNNVNINRPGGRPVGGNNQWNGGSGGRPGGWDGNRPGGGGNANAGGGQRPPINRPEITRPGAPDRPGVGRPGTDRPSIDRPGGNRPGINRPGVGDPSGINRPGGNQSGINRPGGSAGGINRPGGDRIGQEGSRWQPNQNNRPGGGQAVGNRPSDWRNNANQPNARPPSSIGQGANRPGGINRPTTPANPGANRPTNLPATRAPNVQPNRGGNAGAGRPQAQPARPQNPAALPSAGAGSGNRPSGFSGGPSGAASNRGAASRGGGGGGEGGGRPSRR
ncbi:MAG: DUF3300 domain-containing protein [Phycisphaerales bacterium]|nr:DUF3300 domain-containing protein [Phycisphaerales bacterium]